MWIEVLRGIGAGAGSWLLLHLMMIPLYLLMLMGVSSGWPVGILAALGASPVVYAIGVGVLRRQYGRVAGALLVPLAIAVMTVIGMSNARQKIESMNMPGASRIAIPTGGPLMIRKDISSKDAQVILPLALRAYGPIYLLGDSGESTGKVTTGSSIVHGMAGRRWVRLDQVPMANCSEITDLESARLTVGLIGVGASEACMRSIPSTPPIEATIFDERSTDSGGWANFAEVSRRAERGTTVLARRAYGRIMSDTLPSVLQILWKPQDVGTPYVWHEFASEILAGAANAISSKVAETKRLELLATLARGGSEWLRRQATYQIKRFATRVPAGWASYDPLRPDPADILPSPHAQQMAFRTIIQLALSDDVALARYIVAGIPTDLDVYGREAAAAFRSVIAGEADHLCASPLANTNAENRRLVETAIERPCGG